jgi:hypothetical protein
MTCQVCSYADAARGQITAFDSLTHSSARERSRVTPTFNTRSYACAVAVVVTPCFHMKTIGCALIAIAFLMPLQASRDALICQGAMASTVHYTKTRDIMVPEGTQKVVVQLLTALNSSFFARAESAVIQHFI